MSDLLESEAEESLDELLSSASEDEEENEDDNNENDGDLHDLINDEEEESAASDEEKSVSEKSDEDGGDDDDDDSHKNKAKRRRGNTGFKRTIYSNDFPDVCFIANHSISINFARVRSLNYRRSRTGRRRFGFDSGEFGDTSSKGNKDGLKKPHVLSQNKVI
jgi:hypothetical protein